MATDTANLPPSSPALRSPPRLSRPLLLLVVLLVIVPTAVDLTLQNYNLSVVYFIPLIFYAHLRRTRGLWTLGILLALLTYACYFIDRRADLFSNPHALLSYRLLNRTYAAFGILIAAYLIGSWVRFQDYWSHKTGPLTSAEAADSSFIRVEFLLDRAIAALVAILLIAAIAVSDFFAPDQLNQSNLYIIPLVLLGLTMSRKLLWSFVPILLGLTYWGYAMDPPSNVGNNFIAIAFSARMHTLFALLVSAAFLHFWIGAIQRRTRQPSTPTPKTTRSPALP